MSGQLLSPELVAALKPLSLRARVIVEGAMTGMHKSPHHGQSIEFAERKEYAAGDDIRRLDWKALARFDRLYIKKYEEETNLKAFIALDSSASMNYMGRDSRMSKFDYAKTMAAAFIYLLYQQQDKAAIAFFAGKLEREFFSRGSAALLNDGLLELERAKAEGLSDFETALGQIAQRVYKRSLVVVLSDLLDASDEGLRIIQQIKKRGADVVLFLILDGDEIDFPFRELARFEGMEDERFALAEPDAVRAAYKDEIKKFIAAARSKCNESGVDFVLADTRDSFDRTLLPALRMRMKR